MPNNYVAWQLYALALFLICCNDLSVLVPPAASKTFVGLDNLEMNLAGDLDLTWASDKGVTYQVQYFELDDLPAGLSSSQRNSIDKGHAQVWTSKVPPGQPISAGVVQGMGKFQIKDLLNPSKYYAFRTYSSTQPSSFTRFYIIRPDIAAPESWQQSVSGGTLGLTWDNVEGAIAYELYDKQGALLTSQSNFIVFNSYDPTESFDLCLKSRRGKIASQKCLNLLIPVTESKVRIERIWSPSSATAHRAGSAIPIHIEFSEAVHVVKGFNLKLRAGDSSLSAALINGSGSKVLEFSHTVQAGENTETLESIGLELAKGDLLDSKGIPIKPAIFGLDSTDLSDRPQSLSAQSPIIIDTTVPNASSSAQFAPQQSGSLTNQLSWTPAVDIHLLRYHTKICTDAPCSSNCIDEQIFFAPHSTGTFTGLDRSIYYGCVRAEDTAGNLSAWTTSQNVMTPEDSITFQGVANAKVLGSWDSDGTAKLELTLLTAPTGPIATYQIFFSKTLLGFDYSQPIATVTRGDPRFDAISGDTKLLASIPVSQLFDGYYSVRAVRPASSYLDTNTFSTPLTYVLQGQAGYTLVPKKFSSLSYDFFLMRYEASLSSSGVLGTGDSVTVDEPSLARCAYSFHVSGTALDPICGTPTITKKAQSTAGGTPVHSLPWDSSFYACRNASDSNVAVRLPTSEEWERAASWGGASYSSFWSVQSAGTANKCNISGAGAGPSSSLTTTECKTPLNAVDMSGNLKEWVDQRMVAYDITAHAEQRFSLGPVVGRTLRNGMDNLSRRYHRVNPGVNGLALTLGSDWKSAFNLERKQYGSGVQSWIDPTTRDTAIGFRCVAFLKDTLPSLEQLSLPDDAKFTPADLSAPVTSRSVPENFFVHDDRWESLRVNVDPASTSTESLGSIAINWVPWQKRVCDVSGVCSVSSANLTYHLYRFAEPNRVSYRMPIPWALAGTGSTYASDTPLNPLATDANGHKLFTSSTADGRLIASIANCSTDLPSACAFTDSDAANTNFSSGRLYWYILVAEDSTGNARVATVQKFRSSYFTGDKVSALAKYFRTEPRYRRAGVFPVTDVYQSAQVTPNMMVYVPMDQSGLDHDFFMHKYEAALSGGVLNTEACCNSYTQPRQTWGGGWSGNAALCFDILSRTNAFDYVACASSNALFATNTAVLQSKPGLTPVSAVSQGPLWKACRNTEIQDSAGFSYRLHLPSSPEWFKAADWGDVDFDGTIDQNPFTGTVSVASLESGTANNTTVRCHTDNNPATYMPSGSTETANCVSRYGARDMVGNYREIADNQTYAGVGQDNGTDALWMGSINPPGFGTIATAYGNQIDVLIGKTLGTSAGSILPVTNADYYGWNNTWWTAAIHGGYKAANGNAGRFYLEMAPDIFDANAVNGGRCAL
jgi:formylglycine-generating enzyme required for sulfatase activity